jgi:hypothetical protein
MKNLVLVLVLVFTFGLTSCEQDVIESPQSECSQINGYYENLTAGLTPQEASLYIQEWQDALNAAGCPSLDTI